MLAMCYRIWWAELSIRRTSLLEVSQDFPQLDAFHTYERRPRSAAYPVGSSAGRRLVLEHQHIQRPPALVRRPGCRNDPWSVSRLGHDFGRQMIAAAPHQFGVSALLNDHCNHPESPLP